MYALYMYIIPVRQTHKHFWLFNHYNLFFFSSSNKQLFGARRASVRENEKTMNVCMNECDRPGGCGGSSNSRISRN